MWRTAPCLRVGHKTSRLPGSAPTRDRRCSPGAYSPRGSLEPCSARRASAPARSATCFGLRRDSAVAGTRIRRSLHLRPRGGVDARRSTTSSRWSGGATSMHLQPDVPAGSGEIPPAPTRSRRRNRLARQLTASIAFARHERQKLVRCRRLLQLRHQMGPSLTPSHRYAVDRSAPGSRARPPAAPSPAGAGGGCPRPRRRRRPASGPCAASGREASRTPCRRRSRSGP